MNQGLTAELRGFVTAAEADLRARSERSDLGWARALRAEYEAALGAGRTALSWSAWRDGEVAQVAVGWVLGTVFVRFCEDNDLVGGRWIAGPGDGLRLAVDAETAFYAADPRRGTSDWLRAGFAHLRGLPASGGVLAGHSPVWGVPLGDDVCRELLTFWRTTGGGGELLRDLRTPDLDTRFLGDLYQDLSELARKRFALLQTPVFVEEFILDRTLSPAVREFGLPGLRLIDPTCGSGHFLLGAFARLLAAWEEREPGAPVGENVRRALDAVHGVDVNPFAAAIARFRLAVAALRAAGYRRLADAPEYVIHVAVGDSLLGGVAQGALFDEAGVAGFFYRNEDVHEHPGMLEAGRYHVVVGNPPYITVKDKALNETYRGLYSTCKGKYALSVPFLELFFQLASKASAGSPAGFVGQITSNSFMKREFGAKVIEQLLSGVDSGNPVDLLDVIDTSGAYIPGHGTPTVILVGRRRRPIAETVRAVLGVRGEPGQPDDPAKGLVWTEIVEHVDQPGFDGTYVTVTDLDRDMLKTHPWSLSGGGAGDVKEAIEEGAVRRLDALIEAAGITAVTGEDAFYMLGTTGAPLRLGVEFTRPLVEGDVVRDYLVGETETALWTYDDQLAVLPLGAMPKSARWLSAFRSALNRRRRFGTPMVQRGLAWWEWQELYTEKLRSPLSIVFAFVATHNHFVLDRGGKVFNRSAPVIKLPAGAGVAEHLGLLGVLNSSAACFWLKQVNYAGGGDPVGASGARVSREGWSERYQFNSGTLEAFPLPGVLPLECGRALDALAQDLAAVTPAGVCASGAPTRARLAAARAEYARIRGRMIGLQEELDWFVYHAYGLIDQSLTMPSSEDVPGIRTPDMAAEFVWRQGWLLVA